MSSHPQGVTPGDSRDPVTGGPHQTDITKGRERGSGGSSRQGSPEADHCPAGLPPPEARPSAGPAAEKGAPFLLQTRPRGPRPCTPGLTW